MADLAEGEVFEMKGSAAQPYVIKNTGGVYSCSCPAWRNQSIAIESRTCKHIRKLRGDAAETERIGNAVPTKVPSSSGSVSKVDSDKPPLLLAHAWDNTTDLSDWWISEKLDGVRAYWTGKHFLSREGNQYHAPDWFIKDLPDVPLDGELWIDRGKFQRTVSVVRRQDKSDHWKEVRFVVFDAPAQQDPFEQRLEFLRDTIAELKCLHTKVLDQERCSGEAHLRKKLAEIEALGGEGLMLRQPASLYEVGRSTTLLKVKTFFDAEAVVVDHTAGKGRHKGRVGALVVQLDDGTQFNVGTGLSDAARANPPAVGSVITFRYQELTDGGVPRFPSFLRVASNDKVTAAQAKSPKKETSTKVVTEEKKPDQKKSDQKKSDQPAMEYFEFSDGKSEKFWEIGRDGCEVTVRYGRIGTAGQVQKKTFATDDDAQKHEDKLIEQKTGKGYKAAKSPS